MYLALFWRAYGRGESWCEVSQEALAAACGVTRKTVKAAMKALAIARLVKVEQAGTKSHATRYRVHLAREAGIRHIDEFQTFATLSLAGILQEARKYRLNLIMAHQYLGQLEEAVRNAIFGNVGTIIAFRLGAEDAKYMAREFYPVFAEDDFLNLPPYRIYLRLMIGGVMSRAFSVRTYLS